MIEPVLCGRCNFIAHDNELATRTHDYEQFTYINGGDDNFDCGWDGHGE